MMNQMPMFLLTDRKSTRLNSSHTEIYTLSLHDALPISLAQRRPHRQPRRIIRRQQKHRQHKDDEPDADVFADRSEEHTSELQSHRDLHSFPTRRSSDLLGATPPAPATAPDNPASAKTSAAQR